PATPEERMQAWRARLACPTASVRTESHEEVPEAVFPEHMCDGVHRLGYNARSSYGTHSFLIRRAAGNLMVDAPRWTRAVVGPLEAWGGISDILLTHRDDIGDAERYARHFDAHVWIHEADRDAAPFADRTIAGIVPVRVHVDLLAIPAPGHTEGSVAYLYDGRCLFTGDTLAWSFERDDLTAWREVCWWSWPEQLRSLRRLCDHRFEWVFAGHGGSRQLPADDMAARLAVR
ncbi:MBL fold metallo-hydrolase, partial [Azospirillum sp. TSO22-1]|uniref:MBL fold metallo-hydrolase n=1 Tax=Azospirillum sp. TSO22-1 TaxID=716789 RepID=UPI000D612ACE